MALKNKLNFHSKVLNDYIFFVIYLKTVCKNVYMCTDKTPTLLKKKYTCRHLRTDFHIFGFSYCRERASKSMKHVCAP